MAATAASSLAPPSPVQLVSLRDVGARLQLSYWASRDLVLRGFLPAIRLPGRPGKNLRRILVSTADLEAFIADHRVRAVHVPTPNPNMKRAKHRQRGRRVRRA
jgi:hypothetical protein